MATAATGEGFTGLDTRRRRKDGKLVDVRLWMAPLRSATAMMWFSSVSKRR